MTKHSVARLTGIPSLFNFFHRKRLLIITYHGIYNDFFKPGDLPDTFVHVDQFAMQLREISRRYQMIDSDALRSSLMKKTPLPPQSAMVTFDDGYESFHRLATPVLNSLGIRAVVFITTRNIETESPFWFDLVWLFIKTCQKNMMNAFLDLLDIESNMLERQALTHFVLNRMKRMGTTERDRILLEMEEIQPFKKMLKSDRRSSLFFPMTAEQLNMHAEKGVTFGGHTHTHSILSCLPTQAAEYEIRINREKLEAILNRPCDLFAFPNGGRGDFSETHKMLLKKNNFIAAFSLTQERNSPLKDPMEISRINVAPEDTPESLLLRCTGITPIINRIRKANYW